MAESMEHDQRQREAAQMTVCGICGCSKAEARRIVHLHRHDWVKWSGVTYPIPAAGLHEGGR